MRPILLLAVSLLGCSDDAAPGRPSGLTAGDAGRSGSSQAGAGGSPVAAGGSAGETSSGGQTIAAAGQGGASAVAPVGGSAGETSAAGQAGDPAGQGGADVGQAGQEAGGSDAGQGGEAGAPQKTPAELGCSFSDECIDGRDGYKCPSEAEPDSCVRFLRDGANTWCCGTPKPTMCEQVLAGGATKEKARKLDALGNVSIPAKSTGWLSEAQKIVPLSTMSYYVESTATPLGAAIQVCAGYVCADGTDGVKACAYGQKVADGITLCCVDGDLSTTGKAPIMAPYCQSELGTAYVRLSSKADTCIDVKRVYFSNYLP